MDEDLKNRIQEALEWFENGPEPSPENVIPAEVYCLKRAARNLNRLRSDHADTTKLAEAESALALKMSHARFWDIPWSRIGEIIGISGAEAEALFDRITDAAEARADAMEAATQAVSGRDQGLT